MLRAVPWPHSARGHTQLNKWARRWGLCLVTSCSSCRQPVPDLHTLRQVLVLCGELACWEAGAVHRGKLWQNSNSSTRVPPCPGILAWAVSFWPRWLCHYSLGQDSIRYVSLIYLTIGQLRVFASGPAWQWVSVLWYQMYLTVSINSSDIKLQSVVQ